MEKKLITDNIILYLIQSILILFFYDILLVKSFILNSIVGYNLTSYVIIFFIFNSMILFVGFYDYVNLKSNNAYFIKEIVCSVLSLILLLAIFSFIISGDKHYSNNLDDIVIFFNIIFFVIPAIIPILLYYSCPKFKLVKISIIRKKFLLFFINLIILSVGFFFIMQISRIREHFVNAEINVLNVKVSLYSIYVLLIEYILFVLPTKILLFVLFDNIKKGKRELIFIIIPFLWIVFINIVIFANQ